MPGYIYVFLYICVCMCVDTFFIFGHTQRHTLIQTHMYTYVGTYTHICKRMIALYSINNGNPLVVKLLVIPNTYIKCFCAKTAFLL